MRYLLFFLLLTKNILAQTELYRANDFYDQGNYSEATKIYNSLEVTYKNNGELFYNMGNVYFRIGDLGRAIYYFRKSAEISPRDGDVWYNLDYVRKKTIDKIDLNKSWIDSFTLRKVLNLNEELFFITILCLITFSFWTLFLFRQFDWIRWGRIVSLSGLILFSAIVFKDQILNKKFGVVISKEMNVFSATGKDNVILFTLHEGCEFYYTDIIKNDWVLIELSDGKRGWAKRGGLII